MKLTDPVLPAAGAARGRPAAGLFFGFAGRAGRCKEAGSSCRTSDPASNIHSRGRNAPMPRDAPAFAWMKGNRTTLIFFET